MTRGAPVWNVSSAKRWEAGGNETEFLVVEGLKYLKKLDGASED